MNGIAEIYPCIQGEGSRAGMPSILIRTLGCNLRCAWCDTPFTSWQLEKGSYSNWDIIPVLQANPQIEEVIISGGEPCIYPHLEELINICKKHNTYITLETNGTRLLSHELIRSIDLVSLSPKLSNSIPAGSHWQKIHDKERIDTDVLREWISSANDYQLKFVVSSPGDLPEIRSLITAINADKRHVYLMPEGTVPAQLQEKRLWLADLCIREGYRYCERIHVVIYGDKRGV